jgi:hypothetical protein
MSKNKPNTKATQYQKEARKLAALLLSPEVTEENKTFFRFYLSDLAQTTGIIKMDEIMHDMPHLDPTILPLVYPVMRERDGHSRGVASLINSAFCTLSHGKAEEDAFSEAWASVEQGINTTHDAAPLTKKGSREELAHLLYAALNHPKMQATLRQGIYHALNDFQNEVDLNQLCYSQAALLHTLELATQKKKGGKR